MRTTQRVMAQKTPVLPLMSKELNIATAS